MSVVLSMKSTAAMREKPHCPSHCGGVLRVFGVFLACAAAVLAQDRGGASSGGAKSAYQLEMEKMWRLHPTLAIGSQAPDFNLPGVDGRMHKLGEYKASPVLAMVFMCNHCPASQLYEGRIKQLVSDFESKGLKLIGIQPNAYAVLAPHELNYSDLDDRLEGMKMHAAYRHFNFPYLNDGETQA